MRETTPEGRLFIGLGAATAGLCAAVAVSATSLDGVMAELVSPRRWVLVAMGVMLNLGTLALMRRFIGAKSVAIFVAFTVLIASCLASGIRFMQVQVPIAFWLADILVMGVCVAVVQFQAARQRAMQPDVQSSFLASRLWK
jgi:hypothetical protein